MSAEPFVLGSRDFGEEVAACIQIDPRSHLRLNSTEARELHRYLSALVLPAVERRMLETSRYCGQDKREVVYVSPLGVAASCVGRAVVCGETMMSIEVARAKAACLLAAADEAEGLAP